jgi:HAD superfamily hydrolase (TIGR01450 family)
MQNAETIFERYEEVRPRLPGAVTTHRSIQINSLLDIADQVDAFVFDAFGVLNVGETLIEGADVRVDQLRARGCQIRILTNAASYDRAHAVEKFRRLGVRVHDHEIVTSRDAALESLPDLFWGVVAADGDPLGDLAMRTVRLGDDARMYHDVEGFLFLSSADWTDERQALLTAAMDGNPRPLVIANPDLVAPRDGGFSLEPGYFGHLICDRHPHQVRFFGKPFPEVYRLVEKTLAGVPASRIAMCGDTLHTDVLGAAAQGWRTVLVTRDGLFAGLDTDTYSERSALFAHWKLERI